METKEQLETFIADLKEQLAIHPDNKAYQYDLAQANLRLSAFGSGVGDGDADGDDGGIGNDDPAYPGT